MKRSPLRRRAPEPREDADPGYIAWLQGCDCAACARAATDDIPTHAHHATLTGRGKSQKSPDAEALPLCWRCHSDLHALRGKFANMTHDTLRSWQRSQVEVHRGWYLRLFGSEVL